MKIVPNEDIISDVVSKGIVEKEEYLHNLARFDDVVRGRTDLSRRTSIESYMRAVEFATYVASGCKYTEAYEKTFPEKASDKKAKSYSNFTSSASLYAKGDLVSEILSRTWMASHILFMPEHHIGMTELFKIGMDSDVSARDRIEALKAFTTGTKKPDDKKGDLQVNIDLGSIMHDIDSKIQDLSSMARNKIIDGTLSVQELAEGKVVNDGN